MKYRRARDLRLTSFVATPVKVPLLHPFHDVVCEEQSLMPAHPKYILRAGTNKGLVGLGETYENVNLEHLKRNAIRLLGCDFDQLQINRLPLPVNREYDGFELLAYDILGQELKVPAYQLLGDACRDRVTCCRYVQPDMRKTDALEQNKAVVDQAMEAQAHGFDCAVITCSDAKTVIELVHAVHENCGRTLRILLAPIKPWGDEAVVLEVIQSLKGMQILGIENPLGRGDMAGLSRLRAKTHVPIMVRTLMSDLSGKRPGAGVLDALKYDACDGFHISHAMAAFVRLADVAELAGLACRHGGMGDLGILEAGYVHAAAASPSCVWPSNIFGRWVREHDLLKAPLAFVGRHVVVPQRPGLGVALDVKAMERYRAGDDIVLAG